MRRLLMFLTFMGATSLLQASCGEDPPPPSPELTVSTNKLDFDGGAGEKTFHVRTNVTWNISVAESVPWLTVSPTSGEGTGTIAIKVGVARNPVSQTRSATFTVKAGELSGTVTVTQGYLDMLEVENARIENISAGGTSVEVKLKTSDVPVIAVSHRWITDDGSGSPSGDYNTVLRFRIDPAVALMSREGTITFRVGTLERTVTVVQNGLPLSIAPDGTGMEDGAAQMAAKMGVGWNLGNTMEPPDGEGAWSPRVTRELIRTVAAAGFKNIRIPCAWNSHITDQATHRIDPDWLDRVAEVVGWCLEEGLYVMVNIHWDGGWLEEHPYYVDQMAVNARQKALWEQIAVRMRDFDQRLTFAGTNEVHHGYDAPRAENIEVQLSFNQTFVEAVRSTGGRNAYRNLVVQAYNTNIDLAVQYLTMPDDTATGRLFAEVHYYDPYEFTIASDGNTKLVWGNRPEAPIPGNDSRKPSWGAEDHADMQFARMKTNFVDRGIPVIVGEYGGTFRTHLNGATLSARDKADHDASNVYYIGYVTRAMKDAGLVPVYWDNGGTADGSGIFDRNTYETVNGDILEAIMKQ